MTADATLPASGDLTPEVLARWEELAANATEGPWFREYGDVITSDTDPRDAWVDEPRNERIFQRATHRGLRDERAKADSAFAAEARTAVPALLSGVRSRDARIAEQDEEITTLRQQRHDALEAVAARDAVIEDVRGAWTGADIDTALEAAPSSVLAARDAETAAKALEKAAGEMPVRQYSDSGLFSRPLELGDIRYWLRARAAEIREGN